MEENPVFTEQSLHIGSIADRGKRMSYGNGMAVREPSEGKGRFDLITPFALARLARWYELGAKKYSDRNWERGMPYSRYIDSALRHLNKYIMGMEDEDHLAAAAWNIFSIIHHQELGQAELDDMPHYLARREEASSVSGGGFPGAIPTEAAKKTI